MTGPRLATDQVRIRFDARQLVVDDVRRLLDQAQPLDNFMHDNPITDRARNDWSTLRTNLSVLASAYNVTPNWINNSSLQTGYLMKTASNLQSLDHGWLIHVKETPAAKKGVIHN